MKRICALLTALLLLLTGCASPVPSEYTVVQQHAESAKTVQRDALTASTYDELKYDILSFVESGVQHGVIHVYNYSGDVNKDSAAAVYDVWKNDPVGAYAVEYMTSDCNLLLSYYEVRVEITFRHSSAELSAIQYVRGTAGAKSALETALVSLADRLTLRISAYEDGVDWNALAAAYYSRRPETMMELPKLTASVYPDSGNTRIVELKLQYTHSTSELTAMKTAVANVLNSAVSYVRYRQSAAAKAELLFTYLTERFDYREGETSTPAYSLLCEGVAESHVFAGIFQVLCDRIGIPCQTVSGYVNGESYAWNILKVGDVYRHVDLMRGVREGQRQLAYYTDAEMAGYSWDQTLYPACTGTLDAAETAAETQAARQTAAQTTAAQTAPETVPETTETPAETAAESAAS